MPPWAQRLARKALLPQAPVKMAPYPTPSDLPPAADFLWCHALVVSIPMIVFSNGVHWLRADTGGVA
jgi:hypothetical protein